MHEKVRFYNKINVRMLLTLVVLFTIACIVVSVVNMYLLRSIYEESFTAQVLQSNGMMANLVDGDEVKRYVDMMANQSVAFKREENEFNKNREELARLQEEGAPQEEQDVLIEKMQAFHDEMDAYKNYNYRQTLEQIKKLRDSSGAKYVYIVADTGVKDDNGDQLFTYIFDAEDNGAFDSPDSDGLGTASYFEDVANEVIKTKKPMDKVLYYNEEPYGELYYAYAPIIDSKGDAVAVLGTDVDPLEMNTMITRSLWINNTVFIIFAAATCILLYFWMSRSIAKPLEMLTNTASKLAEGDVYASVPESTLRYKNELGLLAHAIDDTSSTYQDMIESTGQLFNAASIGKLDVRSDPANYKGGIAKVAEQINATMDATTMYLNSVPEGLFIMNKQFDMYFSNNKYKELFGDTSALEFVRLALLEKDDASAAQLGEKLDELLQTGAQSLNFRKGNMFFATMFREMSLKGSEVKSVLAIAVDITDLMNEKMNAQAANNAKSEFLSRVSHELRTPMNVILGMSAMGLKEAQSDALRGRFRQIDDASRHLLNIINDVLDMSRIESGRMEVHNEPFDLRALLDETVALFAQQAQEKGLVLRLDVGDTLPSALVGDSQKLKQVLINICGNSMKFTEKGGSISLAAKLLEDEGDRAWIGFDIADTGIGMSEEFIKKIFNPFEQESVYLQRVQKGTGLGLPIVKNLVTLMGGEIHVSSKQNEGSRFEFQLPFAYADGKIEAQKEDKAAVAEVDISGMKVLLVDDMDINRIIFSEMLANQSIDITEASDGAEALQIFKESKEGHFDIVFMDIQMPNMDGYEATRRIRALSRKDNVIPIIAMTANALKQDVDQAHSAGMNGHISKPIDYDACVTLMRKYFAKK